MVRKLESKNRSLGELSEKDVLIVNFINLMGYRDLTSMLERVFDVGKLREREILLKYRDGDMRGKLNEKFSSTYIKRLRKGYEVKDEMEILSIFRSVMRRVGYEVKSARIEGVNEGEKRVYWLEKAKKVNILNANF